MEPSSAFPNNLHLITFLSSSYISIDLLFYIYTERLYCANHVCIVLILLLHASELIKKIPHNVEQKFHLNKYVIDKHVRVN